jgi:hypothetical protein
MTGHPVEVESIRSLLRAALPHAVSTLVEIMLDVEARDADRIAAASKIIDHVVPKPSDTTEDATNTRDLVRLLSGGEDILEGEADVVPVDDTAMSET